MQLFSRSQDTAPSNESDKGKLKQQLEEKMIGLFEQVTSEKNKYYQENSDKLPAPQSVPSIVNSCAIQNAVISGGAGLVPGPLGMLAVLPEIALIVRNQLSMVYDIGLAYGHGKKLNADVLASVFGFALGSGTLGLIAIHGQKVLVKRASLRLMQKFVQLMAGKISQRLLKSMVGKWIPVAGAVALAAWSKFSTHAIAGRAKSLFEKDFSVLDEFLDEVAEDEQTTNSQSDTDQNFDDLKIKALINLMRIDGSIADEEQEYIALLIEKAEIADEVKLELIENMNQPNKIKIDYTEIKESPEDSVGLIIDMVALAKRDNEFHISERLYIKQVGKILNISASDLEEAMSSVQLSVE